MPRTLTRMTRMRFCAALSITALMTIVSVGHAQAAPREDVIVIDVKSGANAHAIYSDIIRVAKRVCDLPGASANRAERACRNDVADAAIARADIPALIRFHEDRTGRSVSVLVASH